MTTLGTKPLIGARPFLTPSQEAEANREYEGQLRKMIGRRPTSSDNAFFERWHAIREHFRDENPSLPPGGLNGATDLEFWSELKGKIANRTPHARESDRHYGGLWKHAVAIGGHSGSKIASLAEETRTKLESTKLVPHFKSTFDTAVRTIKEYWSANNTPGANLYDRIIGLIGPLSDGVGQVYKIVKEADLDKKLPWLGPVTAVFDLLQLLRRPKDFLGSEDEIQASIIDNRRIFKCLILAQASEAGPEAVFETEKLFENPRFDSFFTTSVFAAYTVSKVAGLVGDIASLIALFPPAAPMFGAIGLVAKIASYALNPAQLILDVKNFAALSKQFGSFIVKKGEQLAGWIGREAEQHTPKLAAAVSGGWKWLKSKRDAALGIGNSVAKEIAPHLPLAAVKVHAESLTARIAKFFSGPAAGPFQPILQESQVFRKAATGKDETPADSPEAIQETVRARTVQVESVATTGWGKIQSVGASVTEFAAHVTGKAVETGEHFGNAIHDAVTGPERWRHLSALVSGVGLTLAVTRTILKRISTLAKGVPILGAISGSLGIVNFFTKVAGGTVNHPTNDETMLGVTDKLPPSVGNWLLAHQSLVKDAAVASNYTSLASGILMAAGSAMVLTGIGAPIGLTLIGLSPWLTGISLVLNPISIIGPILKGAQAVSAIWHRATEGALRFGEWARDKRVEVGEWTTEKAGEFRNFITVKAHEAHDWVVNKGQAFEAWGHRKSKEFSNWADKKWGQARSVASNVATGIGAGAKWLWGRATGAATRAIGETKAFVGAVGSGISTFAHEVAAPYMGPAMNRGVMDGELTGPFVSTGEAIGPHSESTREAQIAAGAVMYINGIQTPYKDHRQDAISLANRMGLGPNSKGVVGVYVATTLMDGDVKATRLAKLTNSVGSMVRDLWSAAEIAAFRTASPAVTKTQSMITKYGDPQDREGGLDIVAHSKGSIVLAEALWRAQQAHANLNRLNISTYGNAAFSYPEGPHYRHFVHSGDPVSRVFGTNSAAAQVYNSRPGNLLRRLTGEFFRGGNADDAQAHTTVVDSESGIGAHHFSGYMSDPNTQPFSDPSEGAHGITGPRPVSLDSKADIGYSAGSLVLGGAAMGLSAGASAVVGAKSLLGGLKHFFSPGDRSNAASGAAAPAPNRIQRSGGGRDPEDDPDGLRRSLTKRGGSGFSPDSNLRQSLLPHLGFDPGGARLHTGPSAAHAARSMNAEAFTIGRDVFFGEDRFDPHSTKGQALLAHELTHVGQQTGTIGDQTRFFSERGGDEMEREAQLVASSVHSRQSGGIVLANLSCEVPAAFHEQSDLSAHDLEGMAAQAWEIAKHRLTSIGLAGDLDSVSVDLELHPGSHSADATISTWANAFYEAVARTAARSSHASPAAVQSLASAPGSAVEKDQGVSAELADAPDAPTSRERVSKWLRLHQPDITTSETENQVDRRAIAGAIAWEALCNVKTTHGFVLQIMRLFGSHVVGPGKFHVFEEGKESLAEELEQGGFLGAAAKGRSKDERASALASGGGSIDYIGAAMGAFKYEVKNADPRYLSQMTPPILTHFYNTSRLPEVKTKFDQRALSDQVDTLTPGSPMAKWVAGNMDYLTASVGSSNVQPIDVKEYFPKPAMAPSVDKKSTEGVGRNSSNQEGRAEESERSVHRRRRHRHRNRPHQMESPKANTSAKSALRAAQRATHFDPKVLPTSDEFRELTGDHWYNHVFRADGLKLVDRLLDNFHNFVPDVVPIEGSQPLPTLVQAIQEMSLIRDTIATWIKYGAENPEEPNYHGAQILLNDLEMQLRPLRRRFPNIKPDQSSEDAEKVAQYTGTFDGDANSVFTKVAGVIESAVPNKGTSMEGEFALRIPIEAFHLGGKLKLSAERDEHVKVRGELFGLFGLNLAEKVNLEAELGGYIESQAPSAADAMKLVSYSLYRRGQESKIPSHFIDRAWGGFAGGRKEASSRSEAWAAQVEKEIFSSQGDDDPELSDDEKKKRNAARKEIYVETGGIAGIAGSASAGANLEGELRASSGRRYDADSILAGKGEIGKILTPRDSKTKLSKDTSGWKASATIELGKFKGGLDFERTTIGDSHENPDPAAKDEAISTLKVNISGEIPTDQALKQERIMEAIEGADAINNVVRKIVDSKKDDPASGQRWRGVLLGVAGDAALGIRQGFTNLKDFKSDFKADKGDSLTSQIAKNQKEGGVTGESKTGLEGSVEVNWKPEGRDGSVKLSYLTDMGLKASNLGIVPKNLLEATITNKRMLLGGKWDGKGWSFIGGRE